MFKRLFGIGIYGKLHNLLSNTRKHGYSCGNQIYCQVSVRPKNKYGFSASVTTNDPHFGGLDGTYQFYYSKSYNTFIGTLLSLTEAVAYTSQKIPSVIFYRLFFVCSEEDVETYLVNYRNLSDREEWFENAIKCDWRKRHYPT